MNRFTVLLVLVSIVKVYSIQAELTLNEPCLHLPIDLTDTIHTSISRDYNDHGILELSLKISSNLNDTRFIKLGVTQNQQLFAYDEVAANLAFYARFRTSFQRNGNFEIDIDKDTSNRGVSIFINICVEYSTSVVPVQIEYEYSYTFDPSYRFGNRLGLVLALMVLYMLGFVLVIYILYQIYVRCKPCSSCIEIYKDWKEFRAQRKASQADVPKAEMATV